MKNKPKCKLIGENGNIFNLIGIVNKTLKNNSLHDEAKEMRNKAFFCSSYDEVLVLFMEYVDVE